jgi:hypothetical protein
VQRAVLRLSIMALILASDIAAAQMQPGSTGGTIGKTDKSVSGGDDADASRPVEKPKPDRPPTPNSQIGAKPKQGGGPQTFDRPIINGVRVDYCSAWLYIGCGEPAATAWCRSKGLTRAASWKVERLQQTYLQSDHHICTAATSPSGACGGLWQVVCE